MRSDNADGFRDQFRLAAEAFVDVVQRVTPDDWSKPALGVWSVRDLMGHTSRALITAESYLDPTRTLTHPDLVDAAGYFRAAAALADPADVAERGRKAGVDLGDDPVTAVAALVDRVLARIGIFPDDSAMCTPVGDMTLAGYLPTRTFELVVHTLDLARAVDAAPAVDVTSAVAGSLRLAADLAGARADAADVLLALTGRRPLAGGFSVV